MRRSRVIWSNGFKMPLRLPRLARGGMLLVVLVAVTGGNPAEARPRAERLAARRLARAERAAARAGMQLEQPPMSGAAITVVPAQALRPGVVRRLLRRGVTPEEIAAATGGATRLPVVGQPATGAAPGRFAGGGAGWRDAAAAALGDRPPPMADAAVETADGGRPDRTRSVLVGGEEPVPAADVGPVFPGLVDGVPADRESATAVITHEPVELLPPPAARTP